jgi:UDP-N-acetyl-2-amino-2-deoxyglucuronate dehydrogenase
VKVGLVGAGNISDTHARAARAAGLEVAAVAGDNRDKARHLAERYGAAPFDSLDLLLRQPIDIVMIGSPSGCHADQAVAAARAGKHVLVEKPVDVSTARIDALLEEVDRAGVTLGVFFQDRLHPDVVAMKRAIDGGEIGAPILATGEVKWQRPAEYYASSRWRGTWALDGGGALINQGIHTVDLLLHLLGPVAQVWGRTATRLHRIEAEDTAVVMLEFVNGAFATVQATTAAHPPQPRRVEIIGTKGTLVFSDTATSATVANERPHQRIIEDFVDAIRNRRPPICDGHEGRRSVAVVEAVYASSRSSRG